MNGSYIFGPIYLETFEIFDISREIQSQISLIKYPCIRKFNYFHISTRDF